MSWYDTSWKAISEAKLGTALGVASGCAVGLALNRFQIVDFSKLYIVVPILWLVLAFAGPMVVIKLVTMLIDQAKAWWKRRTERKVLQARRRAMLDKLHVLSDDEEQTLAWLVQRNQISLESDLGSPVVAALTQKGFLVPAKGMGDLLSWPHQVPDFVWDELQRTKDRWLKVKMTTKHAPWRRPLF